MFVVDLVQYSDLGPEAHGLSCTMWYNTTTYTRTVIGRAKRALHTRESQFRSNMYIFISQKFKGQSMSIPSGYVQTSTLARAGLHVRAFFAHNIIL